MDAALPVQVFEHGEGQAVSIPPGFKLPADKLTMRQDGPRLVIEPARTPPKAAHPANQALVDLLASWDPIDEEIGPIEDLPPDPVNL